MKRPSTRKGRIYATLAALAATFAATVPLVVTAPGCGLQAEGQRCSKDTTATHDGNEDCAGDLVCTTVIGSQTDVCCPASGVSDIANCQAQVNNTTSTSATSTSATSTSATSTGAGGAGGAGGGTSASTATGAGGGDGGV